MSEGQRGPVPTKPLHQRIPPNDTRTASIITPCDILQIKTQHHDPLISQHADQLAKLCRRHHVERMDVFGSAVVGDFNPQSSDIDFPVEFDDSPEGQRFETRLNLTDNSKPSSDDQSTSSTTPPSKTLTSATRSIKPENPSMALMISLPFAPRRGREQAKRRSQGMPEHVTIVGFRNTRKSTAEITLEQYEENRLLRSAIERQFEIIGEATRSLSNDDQTIAKHITGYQTIIGLRNRIIHEYDNITNPTLWNIIQNNLPTHLTQVTTLLEKR